jgi:hypothetical protein
MNAMNSRYRQTHSLPIASITVDRPVKSLPTASITIDRRAKLLPTTRITPGRQAKTPPTASNTGGHLLTPLLLLEESKSINKKEIFGHPTAHPCQSDSSSGRGPPSLRHGSLPATPSKNHSIRTPPNFCDSMNFTQA